MFFASFAGLLMTNKCTFLGPGNMEEYTLYILRL